MSHEQKETLLAQQLEKYPASLDPDEVAEALGVSRRTVDRLFTAGKLEYFVLDPTAERKQKRVAKAVLIDFMTKN